MRQLDRRSRTRAWLADAGLAVSPTLPLLEDSLALSRDAVEIADRAAVLSVVALAAYHPHAREDLVGWLRRESLWDAMSPSEERFFASAKPSRSEVASMAWSSEAVFALCWVLGVAGVDGGALDACPDDLRWKLPDISKGENMAAFRRNVVSRRPDDVLDALDRLYCLHWRQTEDAIQGQVQSYPLSLLEVIQRRRAFEWLFTDLDWDEVSLDT